MPHAVRRQMQDRRGALNERIETAVVRAGEIAGIRDERRRTELLEQLEERDGARRRRGAAVDERNDRVDDDSRRRRAEELSKLGDRRLGRGRASEAAAEVELEAQKRELIGGDGLREVESEILALREQIFRIVLRQDRDSLALLERAHQELHRCDALAGAWSTAQDVRTSRYDAMEVLVDRQDAGWNETDSLPCGWAVCELRG